MQTKSNNDNDSNDDDTDNDDDDNLKKKVTIVVVVVVVVVVVAVVVMMMMIVMMMTIIPKNNNNNNNNVEKPNSIEFSFNSLFTALYTASKTQAHMTTMQYENNVQHSSSTWCHRTTQLIFLKELKSKCSIN